MNKIFWRNKTLGRDLALLTMVVIVLSTVGVAENTAVSSTSLNIEDKSEYDMGTVGPILLYEGFEDGVMPPPGWSVNVSNPDYTWEIVNATAEPELVHTGEYAAVVRWSLVTGQDEWLISPEEDLTYNYGSAGLSFWVNCWTLVSHATVKVYIDIGDGVNHEIWDMQEDEDWPEDPPFYRQVDINISDFIGNVIKIKWRYVGSDLFCSFALDDIMTYFSPPPPPELEIGNITGGFFQVSAEIKNVGEGDDAYDVNWSISIYGRIRPIWGEWNGTIQNLPAGETEIVSTDGIIFGLGKVDIEVEASEPHYGSSDMKTVKGFVFICYIFIIDS